MPPIRCLRRLVAGMTAAALAAVAACTHETTAPVSSGSTNPALSLPEASMMGEAVTADAESELDGATLSSGTFLPGLAAPITPFGSGDGLCMPSRSPASPGNADGDRVPDSVRIAFDCGFAMGREADTVRGTIDIVDPTPAAADGTSTWTHGTNSYALTVSTDPVLHYNASCAARPKFDAGTIKTTVTRNGTTSTVTIAFTACGQYTVTRS